jgi:hypothetical protein
VLVIGQSHVGRYALEMICARIVLTGDGDFQAMLPAHDPCFRIRQLYLEFPCPHRMCERCGGDIMRFLDGKNIPESSPLVTIDDVPQRWQRICRRCASVTSSQSMHASVPSSMDDFRRDEMGEFLQNFLRGLDESPQICSEAGRPSRLTNDENGEFQILHRSDSQIPRH